MISDPIIIVILLVSWVFALGVLLLVIRWVMRTTSLHPQEDGSMQVPVLATLPVP